MKRIPFALSGVFGLVLALVSGVGCSDDGDGDTLKIAVVGPMSGDNAAFGVQIQNAAQLKVDAVNDAGGIDGKKVELLIMDDKGDATEAANVARKLAGDEDVLIVVGHFNSRCSLAAKDEYTSEGVVEFSPGSTNVNVCVGSPWTFRNLYRDDYQGTFLARYAKEALGLTKVAIFFENDDYGKGLKNSFVAEAGRLGLEVVGEIAYQGATTQDYKSLVDQIRDKGADGVFISGLHQQAALIAKALRDDLQIQVPIFAGDGVMEDAYITLAGQAAEGTYLTTPFLFGTENDTPEVKKFHEDYKKAFNVAPGTWSALTYDAVGMALKAIDEVGPDREEIRAWFEACTTAEKGFVGVTGNTYFDQEGDCYSKGAYVALVKDGQFVPAPKQIKIEQ